jgi:hypothetical protein
MLAGIVCSAQKQLSESGLCRDQGRLGAKYFSDFAA